MLQQRLTQHLKQLLVWNGSESQDTAALADGVQWSGRHAFFSVTIRAYPGPTKEFPTPPWTIRPHQVFFLLPAYKLLLKHVKPAVKTIKARSEGAESVLQNWKWFKKAATQGNMNFVKYASLTNMLVVSLMRRIKKIKNKKKPESLQEKWSLDP